MSRGTSCRRVRQELLERFRLGELILSDSADHLDHLRRCPSCRDEVTTDRGIIIQLRRALAERVGDATPPPDAWLAVVRSAQEPEKRGSLGMGWWATLVGRMRVATAIAGTGLALVLAINPAPAPAPRSEAAVSPAATVPTATVSTAVSDGTDRLDLLAERPRMEVTRAEPAFLAPAPSDDLPPALLRVEVFGSGDEEPAAEPAQTFQTEQVPVLQQPYRPVVGAPNAGTGEIQPDPPEPESHPDPELTNMRD
jgi:hypothetical protein